MTTRMKHKLRNAVTVCASALLLPLTAPTTLADPPTTLTRCKSLDGNLKYSCSVTLMYRGEALSGAEISQRADMPSMPLAHNVPPSKPAERPGKPGRYEFEVELEMHGQWLFTYDLRSPVREQVREKMLFTPGDDARSMEHSPSAHTKEHQHN